MVNMRNILVGIILTIVTIIVSFTLVGSTSGDLITAADNISASGLPLANLFSSSGVVLLIFMAFLLLAIIGVAMAMSKKSK